MRRGWVQRLMPELTIAIATLPIPKARPRVVSGRAYTPAATVAYQDVIQVAADDTQVAELLATKRWGNDWATDLRLSVIVV